ncbi:hypothetical protein QVD17_27775 [Tagetes erecta]|uniref:Uncharacterized protein n=1 Tax=Tagetes erecta TaxID=13708 RepID=A0AAD8KFH2_TARER|nr:hypothetical protein QVD17_27775 [Tagetes erecta]
MRAFGNGTTFAILAWFSVLHSCRSRGHHIMLITIPRSRYLSKQKTILRSRKNASLSKQKLLRSSNSAVEIEPVKPAKEVEISNNLSYPDTPSSGCMDLGSVSNRGLRRSARLSLNPRLSSNTVESLDTPGIIEGNADKKSESTVKVQRVSCLDFGEVCVELEKDGGVGSECLRLRSGKKLLKREADDLVLDGICLLTGIERTHKTMRAFGNGTTFAILARFSELHSYSPKISYNTLSEQCMNLSLLSLKQTNLCRSRSRNAA